MSLKAEPAVPADILNAIRAPFAAYGGQAIDPPILQPLTALLDLAGEAMRARLFVVQSESGEPAALRPDLTISVAQAHIASGAASGRYFYEGKAFRTAPPGADRPVEFSQIGVDSFGPAEEGADVAALALSWTAAKAGGRTDLSVTMGDVGLFGDFLQALGIAESTRQRLVGVFASGRPLGPELERAQAGLTRGQSGSRLAGMLADLPEAEATGVLEELWRLAGIQPVGGRNPAEIVQRLAERSEFERAPPLSPAEAELIGRYLQVSATPRTALDQIEKLAYEAKVEFDRALAPWVQRLKTLDTLGVPEGVLTLSAGFIRAFGYYDGLLFDVRSAALGPDQPVAAGGRYDALPVRLGGKTPGGVGCMVRPSRAWKGAGR